MLVPDYQRTKRGLKFLPYKPQSAADETLLSLAQEMERRLQGQIFVAAFEFAEVYLKRVARRTFFQLRNEHATRKTTIPFEKKAFHAKQKKWQANKKLIGTPLYFAAYVSVTYQNGMGVFLRQLRDGLPLSKDSERFAFFMGTRGAPMVNRDGSSPFAAAHG